MLSVGISCRVVSRYISCCEPSYLVRLSVGISRHVVSRHISRYISSCCQSAYLVGLYYCYISSCCQSEYLVMLYYRYISSCCQSAYLVMLSVGISRHVVSRHLSSDRSRDGMCYLRDLSASACADIMCRCISQMSVTYRCLVKMYFTVASRTGGSWSCLVKYCNVLLNFYYKIYYGYLNHNIYSDVTRNIPSTNISMANDIYIHIVTLVSK